MVDRPEGFDITSEPPTPDELAAPRSACGWVAVTDGVAARALLRALLDPSIRMSGEIAGFGRVVGDGVLRFHVRGVIVAAPWRGRGLGRLIARGLLNGAHALAPPAATIGSTAARGGDAFSGSLGFTSGPTSSLGAGTTRFVHPTTPTS